MEKNKSPFLSPELKQLTLSIIGTAIGVGLTFFVNNQVDINHQRSAQRETAIMAVCDIDEITQGLKEEIQLEDSLFKVTMYVATHQELIDSLPMDTLNMAFKYLYDDPTVVKQWTANLKENAFNSGIDARMNLGNNQFYDNVQSCYYERRSLMKVMADAPVFQRPISKDMYEDFLYKLPPSAIDYDGAPHPNAQREMLKSVFSHGSTTLYIKRYFVRKAHYVKAVNTLKHFNSVNKLLMDISDQEIEEYIQMNARPAAQTPIADQLPGTWVYSNNTNQITFNFHEDSTLEVIHALQIQLQFQLLEEQQEVLAVVPSKISINGRWQLRGDTLINEYDIAHAKITELEIDTSNFPQSALERLKDSLEIKKKQFKELMLNDIQQKFKDKEVFAVSFDKKTNSMILTTEGIFLSGSNQEVTMQFFRKSE